MCGFAGYRLFHDRVVDDSLAQTLCQVLYHRGPDDGGMWRSDDTRTLLVSRRLSIVDTSCAGAQPMRDLEGHVIIVFNGEIYNYRELRQELQQKGYQFRSHSDTEVLLYAYKAWGIKCIQRFDGMFACVIHDRKTGDLYLVRDRMGIKPLYFSTQGDSISFASEIKALWKMPWMVKRISMRGISHYLTYLATPAPMTLFESVYKLPAGFYAKLDRQHELTFTQWYDPLSSSLELSSEDLNKKSYCVDMMRSLLRDAVQKRMIADVPVGALLSGGLDSSLVVALMREVSEQVKTFTVAFDQDPNEERVWARKVAKKYNTDHHELIISEKEAFAFFEKMAYHQDEPLGDVVCIPLYYVSKLARDAGVKVLQVGEGADELFCGYPMYVDYLNMYRYWQLTQHFIPNIARRGLFYAARPFYDAYPNRQDLMRSWAAGRPLFWGGVRLFSELWKEKIVSMADQGEPDPIIEKIYPFFPQESDSYAVADYHRSQFYKRWPQGDFFAAMTYIELKHRLPELLLTRTDKMSMAASVEARVPFLDHRLVEFALNMPMKFKYHQGQTKYILKKAAEGMVPHEIMQRKKVGFSVPVTHWFKKGSYFRAHFTDTLHSKSIWQDLLNRDYSYQLWALQNLMAF
jgi:asparagine synthase (glutamine-hydrolysing)